MKKVLSFVLAAACVSCVGGLTACNDEKTTFGEEPMQETLLGFESVQELLSFYRISIAKTSLNTDETYVTQGESSMKISYHYDVAEGKFAKDMVLGFVPGMKYFDKTTATDIGYYAIDVYNPNGRACEAVVNVGGATIDEYVLEEGWNTLYTYVDRAALYQVRGESIGYYSLTFKGDKGVNADYYVDNWRYYKTAEEFEKYSYDKSLTTSKVFHDFSSSAETKLMTYHSVVESQYSAPRFTINKDPMYALTGKTSLKVSFFTKKNGTMDNTTFKTVDGSLPDFNQYVNGKGWYIYGNIYNDFDYDIYVTYILRATDNVGGQAYSVKVKIPAKSWCNSADARIYLDEVDKEWTGSGISALHLRYEVSGVQGEGCIYLDSLGIAQDTSKET